ncbi:MAG: septation regulator SpoVG [Bacillota bacterium]|nr:septation regulator SpoVG [Bacillota bacterium]
MEVTEVRVRRLNGQGRVRGSASVTFDDAFVVHDIRIVEGEHGLFIAMPSRRTPAGQYLDVAHPITAAMRDRLQGAILAAFQAEEEVREVREGTA